MSNFSKIIVAALILLTCLVMYLFVTGCSSGSSTKPPAQSKRNSYDTVRVLAAFKSAATGQADAAIIKKVFIPDTLSWKEVSPGIQKMLPGPDSFYIISYTVPIRDSTGNVKKDSSGKPMLQIQNVATDKKWVRSGFENIDSTIRELNELK